MPSGVIPTPRGARKPRFLLILFGKIKPKLQNKGPKKGPLFNRCIWAKACGRQGCDCSDRGGGCCGNWGWCFSIDSRRISLFWGALIFQSWRNFTRQIKSLLPMDLFDARWPDLFLNTHAYINHSQGRAGTWQGR